MTFEEPIASRKGKDASPEETVRKITAILEKYGYEATYEAQAPQLETCYFSRVTVNDFGSNGKGTTPAFCMASGYAELMERMQNRVMNMPARHNSSYSRKLTEVFPATDLKDAPHPAIAALKERLLGADPGTAPDDAIQRLDGLIRSLGTEGRYALRSFWSVDEKREVLLPVTFLQLFTGTNGMAAGNTLEEAIEHANEAAENWLRAELDEEVPDLPPVSEASDLSLKEGQIVRYIQVNIRFYDGWDE